jgi:hypothetical protein
MGIKFDKLVKHPVVFLRLCGVSVTDFKEIANLIKPEWDQIISQKKCAGRTAHVATLEDKLLCVLIYYRTYITHEFLGYLFNLHNSNICRLLKKMEPILAKKIAIKKDRSLTPEKILDLIADVSEQQTQRPKYKQKKSYSGKKKRHVIKRAGLRGFPSHARDASMIFASAKRKSPCPKTAGNTPIQVIRAGRNCKVT